MATLPPPQERSPSRTSHLKRQSFWPLLCISTCLATAHDSAFRAAQERQWGDSMVTLAPPTTSFLTSKSAFPKAHYHAYRQAWPQRKRQQHQTAERSQYSGEHHDKRGAPRLEFFFTNPCSYLPTAIKTRRANWATSCACSPLWLSGPVVALVAQLAILAGSWPPCHDWMIGN